MPIGFRIHKIRHCLDIDGVARPLALFDPPIDPGALVRAVAGGAGIAGALAAMNAPIPAFRYSVVVARAKELCSEVRSFGGALLSALEKRDGEALARLRATHEGALLDAVKEVRKLQIDEAAKAVASLRGSKVVTQKRHDHYQELMDEGWSVLEISQMASIITAGTLRAVAGVIDLLAGGTSLIPEFEFGAEGFGGSPRVTGKFGGKQVSSAAHYISEAMKIAAGVADTVATTTGIAAGHERRADEWELQRDLASLEIKQLDLQIEGAQLRTKIAKQELKNHELQRENAAEVRDFLDDKFTNVDLYDWMVGQLASVYVQAYQLALDLARRAERAWQFEVAAAEPPQFIQSTHWDSLRKGLLAGERLAMDLHRMEVAWLEQSRREYELVRHVSLNQLDPAALMALRTTGSCEFMLPEMLFDVDRPGLYHRRIKAIALSLPCVAGPLAPIHATVRLLDSYVRMSSQLEDTTAESYGTPSPEDPRFSWLPGPAQGIVTSRAEEDGGLFELNLRDERYLPFEGHGVAHSRWKIELPAEYRSFDFAALADAILHVRYVAREGGDRLRDAANASVAAWIEAELEAAAGKELQRVFALRTEDAAEYNALFQAGGAMNVDLSKDRFPFAFRQSGEIAPIGGELWIFTHDDTAESTPPSFTLARTLDEDGNSVTEDATALTLTARPTAPSIFTAPFDLVDAATGTWSLALDGEPEGPWATTDEPARLASNVMRESYLIVRYKVNE